MSVAVVGEYKGNKTISLKENNEDKYPFSFGYKKAKLIIENLDSIRQFVDDAEKEKANAEKK